jgi:hypothetical protein
LDADIEKSSNVEFIPLQASTDEKNKLIDTSEIPNKTAVKGEKRLLCLIFRMLINLVAISFSFCRQRERFHRDEQLWK